MPATKDIAWLAGLLEGEAAFMYTNTPLITLNMTDRDVMERVRVTVGNPKPLRPPADRMPGLRKPIYWLGVSGKRAASWMMTLWPLMGERRRTKIAEILGRWRASKVLHRDGLCAKCRVAPKSVSANGRYKSGYCDPCRAEHERIARQEGRRYYVRNGIKYTYNAGGVRFRRA